DRGLQLPLRLLHAGRSRARRLRHGCGDAAVVRRNRNTGARPRAAGRAQAAPDRRRTAAAQAPAGAGRAAGPPRPARAPGRVPDDYGMDAATRLSFDEIETLVRGLARLGVRKLRLTGGEPLLRKRLPELVARLAAIDGIDDLALTTNGALLAGQARALREAG